MGTNYYLRTECCETCGRYDQLHIGKSSVGWCFSLHVIPENGINSLEDWKREFQRPLTVIVDEYGAVITAEELLNEITCRSFPNGGLRHPTWLRENYAVDGPNGLARFRIGTDTNCVGHGEGTWDLITGEFS